MQIIVICSLCLFQDDDEDYDPGNYIEWEDEIYDGEGRPRIEGNFDPDYVLEEEIYDVDCEFF